MGQRVVVNTREWLGVRSTGHASGRAVFPGKLALLLGFISQVKLGFLLDFLLLLLAAGCFLYLIMKKRTPVVTW